MSRAAFGISPQPTNSVVLLTRPDRSSKYHITRLVVTLIGLDAVTLIR
jgi:hypothetical protein